MSSSTSQAVRNENKHSRTKFFADVGTDTRARTVMSNVRSLCWYSNAVTQVQRLRDAGLVIVVENNPDPIHRPLPHPTAFQYLSAVRRAIVS
jgi:hypothetical protein